MAKRRFIAPDRGTLQAEAFAHPVFDGFGAYRDWLEAPEWPQLDALNAALPAAGKRFVVQDHALLADGLHYELRIAAGAIATRAGNWHDLFNAMVWCRYPAIKQALHAQQLAHIAAMGASQRDRAQYALTQFDEAGAIVCVRDADLIDAWDGHDWAALFFRHASAWQNGGIRIAAVVGHALLEHALVPELLMVGKCLVVRGDLDDDACVDLVARNIESGHALDDPLALRPLPLAGIPGWHPAQDARFYAEAPCFRPLRAGRTYPPALAAAAS